MKLNWKSILVKILEIILAAVAGYGGGISADLF